MIVKDGIPTHLGKPEPWHLREGTLLRHFVFGVEDGLISTLGFLAGVSGAALSNQIILLAGVAAAVAGAISMMAGTYLSVKSEKELYFSELEREKKEIKEMPEEEKAEIRKIFEAKGFKGKKLDLIVKTICSDEQLWLDVMMKEEFGLVVPENESPLKSSLAMGASFVVGAFFPLSAYFIFPNQSNIIIFSIIITGIALFAFGAIKTVFTKRNLIKSGIEMLIVGLIASGIGFAIGILVKNYLGINI